MNPRIAEQLLYESEATLRLVDTLLDELQVREPRLRLLQIEDGTDFDPDPSLDDLSELPERLADAATQARSMLDALAQSRAVLERTSLHRFKDLSDETREAPTAIEVREGLERALLLVDRLDAESAGSGVRDLLRDEILEMLEGVRAQEITEQQLNFASSVLRDTEIQLCALVQSLS